MRFLPPVAALADGPIRFDGDPRSYERPLGGVIDALRALGARIDDDNRGALPMTVFGSGALDGGPVEIDASSSSQFVSALLLSAPRFNQGVEVRHVGAALPSMPHIRMTVDMLRSVGAQVDTPEAGGEPNVWRVTPGALLGRDLVVEPDLSNAQPFLAAALVTGGRVTIPDWPEHTTQPGDALREIFTAMGGSCELTDRGLTFTGSGRIHGIDVDLSEVGELTPGIAAVAALADSPSTLRGVAHLRLHETDRLAALTKELNELGGDVTETADGLHIRPRPLHGGIFHTYEDHRLATAARGHRPGGRRCGGGERRHHRQDPARLPRDVDGHARSGGRPRPESLRGTAAMRRYGKNPDEDDIRVRPNPKGNRPRTNIRPKHEDAGEGLVLTVDRGRLTCLIEGRTVTAMKARELGRKSAVVGDRVAVVGDLTGTKDTLARIVRVERRTSTLRRTADDDDPFERVVVANADQLAIVTALADPEPRPRLIDRCLVAAYDAGLDPLLVLTKSDLASADTLLESYGASRRPLPRHQPRRTRRRQRRRPGQGRADGPYDGVRRTLRGGQDDPGQLPGPGAPSGHRPCQRGHRPRAAHHHLRAGAPAARRLGLGHRHPGRTVLRAAPCRPVPGHPRLPGSGAGHRRLPACLQPRRTGLRAGRMGRRRARRSGPSLLPAPPAGHPRATRGRLTAEVC